MAETVVDIPGITMLIELDSGYERRHSTGKVIPPSIRAKILSRYLKAPISSCHDNCKFGLKSEFQTKPRPPMPMRVIRATKARCEGQNVENVKTNFMVLTKKKEEASLEPSFERNSQKIHNTSISKTTQKKFEGQELKMNATISTRCKKTKIVYEASPNLKISNHGDPTQRERQDMKAAETGLVDKEIISENSPNPSYNSQLYELGNSVSSLQPDDSVVKIMLIQREHKNQGTTISSLDERKMSSQNNQNISSDIYTQEVKSPEIMTIPLQVSVSNKGGPTISAARGKFESEIDLKPYESKILEDDVLAAVIEKASEQCQGEIVDNAETNLEKKMKSQGVCYKPVPQLKSQKSINQTSIRRNASTVMKKKINSPLHVPSLPRKAYVPRRNARDSMMKSSTVAYLPKHAYVIGKEKIKGIKEEEACSPMNSKELSGRTSKDDNRLGKEMRIPVSKKKGSPMSYVSLRELDKEVSSVNAKECANLKVPCSKKNANSMKGVYRLKNQRTLKGEFGQHNSKHPLEKILHMIETQPKKKSMVSNTINAHRNNMSISSSSLEAKSFKNKNNRVFTSRSPPNCENNNVKRKAIHASRLDPSSFSPKNMGWRKIHDGIRNRQSSSASLNSSFSTASSGHNKTNVEKKEERSKMASMDKPMGARSNISNNRHLTGKTLSFKKGKVINLQPADCTPMRLKFRKRVLNDQGSADSLKCKGELGNSVAEKKIYVAKGTASGSNSEKVVLRHQNVEMKTNSPSLFNNVIEETASKLVKSRSKVAALVTAFETVISLQDIKPSSTTTVN